MEQPIPDDAYEPPPPPDPFVIQRKKNIKLILQIIIVLIVIRVFVISVDFLLKINQKDDRFKYSPIIIQKDKNKSLVSIIGIIRTSGLSGDEKQTNNLLAVQYQITDFGNKSTQQIPGYYLQADNTQLTKNIGKCARITGFIPDSWKTKKDSPYLRPLLEVTDIKPLDFLNCDPYTEEAGQSATQNNVSHIGTLERTVRPAPDIGYDYLLNLNTPFISSESASGLSQEVKQITLIPKSDTIWQQFELNVNKEIIIHGFEKWGYAESKYILVTSLSEKKDTLDLSNQTYFVDTTDWQIYENTDCKFTFKKPSSLEITAGSPDGDIINTSSIDAIFQPKTDNNWLNLNVGCFYNDGKIPLKQLVSQSQDVIESVRQTTIQNIQGYMKLEKQSSGVKHEAYYVDLPEGRVFEFAFYYPPGTSYLPIARTILATIIFK